VLQRVVKRFELKRERLIIQHKTMLSEVTSQLHGYEEVARRELLPYNTSDKELPTDIIPFEAAPHGPLPRRL
jgi:hypothetical protein